MARHLAFSWKPTIVSGEQIFKNGNSEFCAIEAARAVFPELGGPEKTNFGVKGDVKIASSIK